MNDNEIYLTLELVKGENSEKSYDGTFKLKKYLTNRERGSVTRYLESLCKDIERDSNMIYFYQAVSHLKSHVIDAPRWWSESEEGLNLIDMEPVFALWALLLKAQQPLVKAEVKTEETPTL